MCVCFSTWNERKSSSVCVLVVGPGPVPSPRQNRCENRDLSGLLLLLVSLFLHVLAVLAVGLQQLVPPSEGGGVVPNEVHVVEVVETGAGVERDQVERVPGDVVTTETEPGKKSSLSDICLKK